MTAGARSSAAGAMRALRDEADHVRRDRDSLVRRRRIGSRLLLAVLPLLLSAIAVRGVSASEQSELLYSRGLVALHADRYSDALSLFDQAVNADAKDPYALFYRGVTRGKLKDFRGAVTDLDTAVRIKPDLDEAKLELGVALVQSGQYAAAVPWLEQSQKVPDLEAHSSLFLGLAQLRLGQRDAAHQNFERAATREPSLRVPATYYEGVIAYQEGRSSDADTAFRFVADAEPESEIGREARAFLSVMSREGLRPYTIYGDVGFEYDSNVVLAPSNEAIKDQLGISGQSDGRFTITAGGSYRPWQSKHAQLSVGYEFYQSLHFDLHSFNLQDHRAIVQLVGRIGRVQLGALTHYDYYFLDTADFLQEVTGLPWFAILEGDVGRTEFHYRIRWRDFREPPYSNVRDSVNHAGGFRQYFYADSPTHYVVAGYQFDSEDPSTVTGAEFGYDGHQLEAGVGWTFPYAISLEALYNLRHEEYAAESNGRIDDQHVGLLTVRKQINRYLAADASYFVTINESNQAVYQYDRHIGSISLEVSF